MEMNYYIFFTIAGLINLLLIMTVYFSKKRLKSKENDIYIGMMITVLLGNIIELLMVFAVSYIIKIPFLDDIISKSFLITTETFILLLCVYTITVVNNYTNKKTNLTFINFIFLIGLIFTILLPIQYFKNPSGTSWLYTYGPSTKVVFVLGLIFITINLSYICFNKVKISNKKFIPMYAYILLSMFVCFLQQINPMIIMISFVESLIISLMFHTIENPDVKLVNELELAKKNAERANNAKTEFLSSMSHEIRTPLNAIVGFSNSIMEDKTLQEAKEEAKDIIMASNNLLEIVNGILDISKIEAGKMEIVNVNYNPNNMFNDLVKLIKPRIGDKPIELTTNFSSDIPGTLYGDAGKVREVILNLLTNACKYTEEGTIDFSVSCINEKNFSKLVISVEDTGRGIKADKIDKLFTKFNRLEEDRNTTLEGTGLGLAITKNLVEMMGGKIIVQSKYGSGSKFTIFIKQKIISLEDTTPKTPVSDNDTIDYSNKKILVVDDNNLNIKVACRMLKNYNIIPDTCISGFECLEKIKDNTYDLILLDDMMPKLSGIETLKKMKEDKTFKTPVVILTANAVSGMKEKYLKAGFNDYLAKPIDKLELRRVLNNYLQKGGQK